MYLVYYEVSFLKFEAYVCKIFYVIRSNLNVELENKCVKQITKIIRYVNYGHIVLNN
jgi:hypothetical protein